MPSTQGKAPQMAGYKSSAEPFAATGQTFHMTRGTCGRNFLNWVAERSGQRRGSEMSASTKYKKRQTDLCGEDKTLRQDGHCEEAGSR